ncbi:MAG: pentapeptide repeat-containing protein [Actinomycetota bacterium]
MSGADLTGLDFGFGDFMGAWFKNATFRGAELMFARFENASFFGADLTEADLAELTFLPGSIRHDEHTQWPPDFEPPDFETTLTPQELADERSRLAEARSAWMRKNNPR